MEIDNTAKTERIQIRISEFEKVAINKLLSILRSNASSEAKEAVTIGDILRLAKKQAAVDMEEAKILSGKK